MIVETVTVCSVRVIIPGENTSWCFAYGLLEYVSVADADESYILCYWNLL